MCSEWVKNIAVSRTVHRILSVDSSQCFNVFIAMFYLTHRNVILACIMLEYILMA